MPEFFQLLVKEWAVVSNAPLSFCLLAVSMFCLAYLAARWRYTAVVEQTKAAMEALKERLHLKTEQAEQYKDRALKYDEKVQAIVDSSSADLKQRPAALVADIRDFVQRHRAHDRSVNDNEWAEMAQSGDEAEKQRLWQKYANATMRLSDERNAEWDRRFKVAALVVRDELRSRLEGYVPDRSADMAYEHPTNYFGFTAVADDLERMAKTLPN